MIEESTYIYLLGVLIIISVMTEIWIMNLCLFSRQRGSRCVFLQKLLLQASCFYGKKDPNARLRKPNTQPNTLEVTYMI